MLSLPTAVRIKNSAGTIISQSQTLYDEGAYPLLTCGASTGWSDPGTSARGNATTAKAWLNTTGGWIETHNQFDQCGSVRKSWDGRGNVSEVQYSGTFQFAYPTGTISAVPDPTGIRGSATALTSSTAYDFYTGNVTSTTDANNHVTTFMYSDPLNRLSQVIRPSGGGSTNYFYGDSVGNIHVKVQSSLDATRVIESYKYFDGLGRPHRTYLNEGGGFYLATDTLYDSMGRTWRVSNPYRTTTLNGAINPSGIWTTTAYDALGRALSVTTPDSAVVQSSYSGNEVTVTDQAGKKRRSVTDALGRLTQVIEDPLGLAYATDYTYDVLGNLRKVSQGTQQRFFAYDSLSRLIRARNPEQATNANLPAHTDAVTGNAQWSMSYAYDNNGNLSSLIDPRNYTTSYIYDNINRLIQTSYSDGTPYTLLTYDFATNGKGRFYADYESSTTGTLNYVTAYDAVGRPTARKAIFYLLGVGWTADYVTTRSYNLAGGLTSQTYPSGRTVTYNYDAAGRLGDKDASNLAFTGNLGDGVNRTYSRGTLYSPFGGMAKEQFGTDTTLYNKSFYNSRGQLAEIRVSTSYTGPTDTTWNRGAIINHYSNQCWGMCGGEQSTQSMTDNNGNLRKQDVYVPHNDQVSSYTNWWQGYEYDALNRLYKVGENTGSQLVWQQEYVIDRYGNRTIHQTNTWGYAINKTDFTVDTGTNRLGVPGSQSGVMSYDNAGNLILDTYTGAGERTYDAENRMTKAWANSQWQYYTYAADGRRVRRKVNNQETWQVYGFDGELLADYPANGSPSSPQKEYGYRNGQLLITATAPVGTGTGLQGQYFDNMNFTNLKLTRTDPTVNFDWGGGSPDPSVGADTFTVRWSGKVESQYSQTYTFYTQTDDGVRLWVNGQLLIDKWIDQGPTEWSGQIALTAGQRYDVTMEFYENGGGAMAKFSWSSASQAKQIIPQNRLYPPGSSAQVDLRWLVTDHLGTSRMIIDKTGSLANVRRHDYLPFGEELYATQGLRTAVLGYSGGDGIRQQFTQKERDIETGLDYFLARYYSATQGRFISVDPLYVNLKRLIDPQRLNLYAYTRNNPLKYTDPNGVDLLIKAKTEEEARKKYARFQKGLTAEDRKHVQFVVGDGKNGFAKGTFAVTADKDHSSESGNFKTVQRIANAKDVAILDVVGPKDKITVLQASRNEDGSWSLRRVEGVTFSFKDPGTPFAGHTFFPHITKLEPALEFVALSPDSNTRAYVANDGTDEEIVAVIHHELRHIVLGDFGRTIPKSLDTEPNAAKELKGAEDEAKRNFRSP